MPAALTALAAGLSLLSWADSTPAVRLKPGARVALAGDSITEQKLYTRFIEDYLLMCAPELQAEVCQFGWSGETAQGFLKRMDAALAWFKPDMVTVFYGMNDSTRGVYVPALTAIAAKLETQRVPALIVSPGAMDTYYGIRGNVRDYALGFNKEQGLMGEEARNIAIAHGLGFVDLHTPLLDVMAKAKARYRPNYDVCGADGVHPRANGHLVIAWTILKALGLSGDIGTITVAMQGGSTASPGHRILTEAHGQVDLESRRYPFCFLDPAQRLSPDQVDVAGSTAGILPCMPFNADLNRLRLVVTGLEWDKARVTWGGSSRVVSRAELEQGINLADVFANTPFATAFARVDAAVQAKQQSESILVKHIIGGLPLPKSAPPGLTMTEALERRATLVKNAREAMQPVRHRISVTRADRETPPP